MYKPFLLFKEISLVTLFLCLLLPIIGFAQGNQKTISGKITDAKGISLPGVNVILDASTIGTN
jgi:hypothetical protein